MFRNFSDKVDISSKFRKCLKHSKQNTTVLKNIYEIPIKFPEVLYFENRIIFEHIVSEKVFV